MMKFHRDHRVTVDGTQVGTWSRPDPSGAAWTRSPVWVFRSLDRRVVEQGKTRKQLFEFVQLIEQALLKHTKGEA